MPPGVVRHLEVFVKIKTTRQLFYLDDIQNSPQRCINNMAKKMPSFEYTIGEIQEMVK